MKLKIISENITKPTIISTIWSPASVYIQFPNGDTWEYVVYDNAVLRKILRGRRNMGWVLKQLKGFEAIQVHRKPERSNIQHKLFESEIDNEPTIAMIKNFEKRTKEHIDRVAQNLRKLSEGSTWNSELLGRAGTHDDSKYEEEEREPYVWLTEFYRCKNAGVDFEYPQGIEERVNKAIFHHITTNRHHPEFHNSPGDMSDVDIIEMVCDWTAMAQEYNENNGSAKGWADKNVGKKWVFSEKQVKLIYNTIEQLDSF